MRTAIETTLAVPLKDPEGLVGSCDLFLVDFKIADRERSLEVTGIDPDLRDANLRKVMDLGAKVIGRMPIIPGFTDSRDNVSENVAHLVELGITRVDVLPFHQLGKGKYDAAGMDYALKDMRQLSVDDIEWVISLCESAGLHAMANGG
jgi:pyruvate formate lyase activating enzyme